VKIDRNVPLPPRIANRVTVGPLPLKDLKPGDSILIDAGDDEIDRMLHSVRVRLSRFSSKNKDYKFSSSKVKGGVRIWRV
jgi:hypothetical protein